MFTLCIACVIALQVVLVTVRMKVLQDGRFVRFLKSTDCWCVFSWSMCNQNGHLFSVSRAVFKVVMAYKDHGKTSAKRNSG